MNQLQPTLENVFKDLKEFYIIYEQIILVT